MGGAPVIETIRSGVQFTPAAAASFRRTEAGWGRSIRVNSTYRDYWHQMSMYNNWNAYVAGRGPHPGHSRAIHPDYSIHCRGAALDTPDWTVTGFIAFMARHGWIRTAANDPTEQHHFEYQLWRDLHRNDPAPAGGGATPIIEQEEEDMYIANVKGGDFYLVIGTKAHKLGKASGARQSGIPIIDYVDDWAVAQLKTVVSGIA